MMLNAGLLRVCCLIGMCFGLGTASVGCFPDPPQCVGDNPCDETDSEVDEATDSEVDETGEVTDSELGEVDNEGLDIAPTEVGDADGSDADDLADASDADGDEVLTDVEGDAETADDTFPEVELETRIDGESPPDAMIEIETTPDATPEVETTPDATPEVETTADATPEVETTPDATPEVETGPEIVVLDCSDLTCAADHRECIEGTGAVDAVCGSCLAGYSLVGGECLAATQPPTGVTASTDRATDVEVKWSALANATGYHVYRCDLASCPGDTGWFVLTSSPVTATSYIDDTVAIPALPAAPGNVAATRTSTSQVTLTWSAVSVAAAQTYRYRVVAIGPAGQSPGSQAAQGKVVDRPVTGYELKIDGGGWTSTGGLAVAYDDLQAPAPTVSAATASATQGTFENYVRLTSTGGATAQGAARSYEVRATTAVGPGASGSASGWRIAGALGLQWERSAGASADSFSAIGGATTASYDDTAAPADGSTRWYRIVASAAGAVSQPSAPVSGSRLNPTSLVPTGVTASSDRTSDVEVRWSPVANATGYYVSRCDVASCTSGSWSALNGVAITAASYLDGTVAVPAPPGAPGSVVAGGEPDQVVLTWGSVVAPTAKRYTYRVTAVVSGSQGAPSSTAQGQVAERPVTGYEVRIDAGNWVNVGNVNMYSDLSAPAPTLTAPTATASQSTYAEYVRLTSTGAAATQGALRNLEVRAVTAQGAGSAGSASARRTAGALSYQWERSSSTTASNFSAISNANGASYDDTAAPSDGSVRWYRLALSATGATTVTSAAVSGMKLGPPSTAPTSVVATNDRDDMVMVTWNALAGATSYHVYRDGTKLTSGTGVTTTSYEDRAITAAGSWAAPTALMATTNDTEKVVLGWTAPTRPLGPTASYTVRAVNAAGEGPTSSADVGQKAAPPLLGYEVEVAPLGSGSSWMPTSSTNAAYTHLDPPKGSITGGTMTTTLGMKRAGVDLATSGGSVAAAVQVDYRVRGVLPANAYTLSSASVRGNRAVGALGRQWQRSSGTSNSSFADLAGATGTSFLDTTAPSDGTHRWYQVVLSAPGCNSTTIAAVEGWRLSFVAVTGGFEFTCALTNDGRVWCWGANNVGQLGRGTNSASIETPGRIESFTDVVEIDGGLDQTCARKTNGQVWCWGGNSEGQLGDATNTNRNTPTLVSTLAATAVSVSAGDGLFGTTSCAALSDQRVQCWGSGTLGQLGNNTQTSTNSPVFVKTSAAANLTGALQVSVGGLHGCARTATGIRCWGQNPKGQLGDGTTTDSLLAVQVSSLSDPLSVVAATTHTCARTSTQAVKCWGDAGRLGNGSDLGSSLPVTSTGVTATALAGHYYATSSLSPSGLVQSWGGDGYGGLGNGLPIANANSAVSVTGIGTASAIGAGRSHVCAIVDGAPKCWGMNTKGQLGDGTQTDQPGPVSTLLP